VPIPGLLRIGMAAQVAPSGEGGHLA